MSRPYIQPPSIENMISLLVRWWALNLRAKVTVTVQYSADKNYTESYDARDTK